MFDEEDDDIGAAKRARSRTRMGKRIKNRTSHNTADGKKKSAAFFRRAQVMVDRGGDYYEPQPAGAAPFKIVVGKGAEMYHVDKGGYHIVIVAPAAALDEAVARLENPEAPADAPATNAKEVHDAMVDEGSVDPSDATSGAVAEQIAQHMGCDMCSRAGVTQGDVADDLTGIIPLIVTAAKATTQPDKNGVTFIDRIKAMGRGALQANAELNNKGPGPASGDDIGDEVGSYRWED